MDRKAIVISMVALALMLSGIAFAVSRLYREAELPAAEEKSQDILMRAIPSDAVALAVFNDSNASRNVAEDPSGLLAAFLTPSSPGLREFLGETLRSGRRTAVSLHNNGSLVPLLVADVTGSDSTAVAPLMESAEKKGFKASFYRGCLIVSSSQTLVSSCTRHIDSGSGLSGDKDLAALQGSAAPVSIFLSNRHASKLIQVYASARMNSRTEFVKSLGNWSALRVEKASAEQIGLSGSFSGRDDESFLKAFSSVKPDSNLYGEILPYYCDFAVSVSFEDYNAYVAARTAWKKVKPAQKAMEWASSLKPREIVKASFDLAGESRELVLVRTEKTLQVSSAPAKNGNPGAVASLFGPYFSVTDSLEAAVAPHWLAYGPGNVLQALLSADFPGYTLSKRMSDSGVSSGSGTVVYASLSDSPAEADRVFSKSFSAAVKDFVHGAAYAPFVMQVKPASASWTASLEKKAQKGDNIRMQDRDTTVVVPEGPWTVTNSGTGTKNTFYQNSQLSLCLKDEKGAGVWGIPFKKKIAGYVTDIDYYNNGKIQWLFAAGESLYLIDRLGRFVSGFPVNLRKEVRLGPSVYDFSGAHGYSVTVLHSDNTIARYNLHGQRPSGWKDIKVEETVKALPELLEVSGKNYWVVRTSIRTLIYPFDGGEPLTTDMGGKMIKADSPVNVSGQSVTVVCYDGKTRTIKLK